MLRRLRWFYRAHIWGFAARCKHVLAFLPIIWRFDTCDYSYLLELIHLATKTMADGWDAGSIASDSKKRVREMRIVSALCQRLIDDEYAKNAQAGREWFRIPLYTRRQINKHAIYMAKQDAQYLGRALRNVQCWWN